MLICTFEAWDRENERQYSPEEWDYPLPHRKPVRTCDDHGKPHYHGDEHGRVFAYYCGDDEDLTDCDEFDLVAFTPEWELDE